MALQLTYPRLVTKRDGRTTTFDPSKIEAAVYRCMTNGVHRPEAESTKIANDVAQAVSLILSRNGEGVTVEHVQRLVIQQLWALGHFDAAEQYTLYREERRRQRETQVDPAVETVVQADAAHFPSPLQYFQFIDKYARWDESKRRRETWSECCDRVIGFLRSRRQLAAVTAEEWGYLRDQMYRQQASPAMRVVQMAGPALERCNTGAFNCSYQAIDNLAVFPEALYLLMQGCGVGFSTESQYIDCLPRVKKQKGKPPRKLQIADSTEGWCDALREGLTAWVGGDDIDFDYSLVRPEGARLRIKGGRASGPEPLKNLLTFARTTVLKRQGKRLTSRDCHDMMCVLGKAGQLGGVRRASEIGLSDLDDTEIRDAKSGNWWETAPWLDMANNSATYIEKPTAVTFMEEWLALAKSGSGERGIFNRAGVLKQIPKRRKKADFGTNPCLTADALVAVADGRGSVSIGELAAEGKDVPVYCYDDQGNLTIRWMRHPRVTGYDEPVYKINFDNGASLRVTAKHKFRLRRGSYVEAQYLRPGDSLATLTRSLVAGRIMLSCRGGEVHESRLIAGFFAGREVLNDERVHHKNKNPIDNRPVNLEILPERTHLVDHSTGDSNANYGGVTNEELLAFGRNLARSLGRRFSTSEWCEFARVSGLPQRFSGWREKTLGNILAFSKRCAELEGLVVHEGVDPRVIRVYKRCLDAGLDAEIISGRAYVRKKCEECGDYFTVGQGNRERAYCSLSCSSTASSRDPKIQAIRRNNQAEFFKRNRELLRDQQLEVYVSLRAQLGRDPMKVEWKAACKKAGISCEMCRKGSPFRLWRDLTTASEAFNHKVVSIEFDGYADVYNGTVDEFHNFFVGGWEETTSGGMDKVVWVNNLNCGEILLRSGGLCNLSIAVARFDDTPQTLEAKVIAAAIFGTLQCTLTDFKYIRPHWKTNAEEERLLGVDINGQMDCPLLRHSAPGRVNLLRHLRDVAVKTNVEWATRLGINPSAAVTCVKPSGNSAAFFGCSSGLHPRWSRFQVRRARVKRTNPVARLLVDEGVPYATDPFNETLLVFDFYPDPAPVGTPTRNDLTALQQFENWLVWKENYTEHNPSATIYVGDDEWLALGAAVYANFDKVGGLTFLPRDGGTYRLAPNEELTEEEYNKQRANYPVIHWGKLSRYEMEDMTQQLAEPACAGGQCELF